MKYEMIPRPWLQKWQLENKCRAGCRTRYEVAQMILDDWDEYQWERLPLYVKRDIEQQISETWDKPIDTLYKMGLVEQAVAHERQAQEQKMSLMREWLLKYEED